MECRTRFRILLRKMKRFVLRKYIFIVLGLILIIFACVTFGKSSGSKILQHALSSSKAAAWSPPVTAYDLSKGVKTRFLYDGGHTVPRPEICTDSGSSLKLITLIMSAPTNFNARMAIRQTWGSYSNRRDVKIAFMLGSMTNKTVEDLLINEGLLYGDIIIGRFVDSYDNLTLKTISMMEWVSLYCPKAKFFLKTDDDMFINIPKLLNFTDNHLNDRRVIFGRIGKRWRPIRNPKSKYFVSTNQYKSLIFPDFTTGPAYLLPSSIAGDLYKYSLDQIYLKLEDVYTTGIVAEKLKIRRTHVPEFFNKRKPPNPCVVKKTISIHMVSFSEQFDLWKKLLDGKTLCD